MSATAELRDRTNDFYAPLKRRKDAIEAEYRALTPRSAALHAEAATVFPGGFTRDAVLRRPYAPFIESGAGSRMTDARSSISGSTPPRCRSATAIRP